MDSRANRGKLNEKSVVDCLPIENYTRPKPRKRQRTQIRSSFIAWPGTRPYIVKEVIQMRVWRSNRNVPRTISLTSVSRFLLPIDTHSISACRNEQAIVLLRDLNTRHINSWYDNCNFQSPHAYVDRRIKLASILAPWVTVSSAKR